MKEFKRSERVSDNIHQVVSTILLREVTDPRLEMVTITGARVSDDLRHADIYYSIIGDEKRWAEAKKGFQSSKGFIKKALGRKLKMKYMPDLHFREDKSLEGGEKIDRILSEIIVDHDE